MTCTSIFRRTARSASTSVDYIGEKTKYPGGGPALAARVISDTLGIPTQHHVRIADGWAGAGSSTRSAASTVTLDCPLYERTPKDVRAERVTSTWSLPAGTIDAERRCSEKVCHVSVRHDRLWAHAAPAAVDLGHPQSRWQGNIIARLPELWKAMSDVFSTDLTLVDAIKLANVASRLKPSNVHGMVFSASALKDFVTDEGAMVLVVKDKGCAG